MSPYYLRIYCSPLCYSWIFLSFLELFWIFWGGPFGTRWDPLKILRGPRVAGPEIRARNVHVEHDFSKFQLFDRRSGPPNNRSGTCERFLGGPLRRSKSWDFEKSCSTPRFLDQNPTHFRTGDARAAKEFSRFPKGPKGGFQNYSSQAQKSS